MVLGHKFDRRKIAMRQKVYEVVLRDILQPKSSNAVRPLR